MARSGSEGAKKWFYKMCWRQGTVGHLLRNMDEFSVFARFQWKNFNGLSLFKLGSATQSVASCSVLPYSCSPDYTNRSLSQMFKTVPVIGAKS